MEELDLKELFNLFWSKKAAIILIILIFMVIGVIYTIGFTIPMYSSSTTLVLATSGNNDTNTNTTNKDYIDCIYTYSSDYDLTDTIKIYFN